MITFKAIVIPGNRRKDGTYPVNIRVTFKGKSRRLATTIVCTSADLTRSHKIKNATILNRTDALIASMRDAVKDISPFDLESQDVDWVVARIKATLSKDSFRLDFFAWSEKMLAEMGESTRRNYQTALNAFASYLGRREIDINDITRSLLLDFKEWQDYGKKMFFHRGKAQLCPSSSDRIPKGSSSRYLMKLGHLFRGAKDRYNDEDDGVILIPRSPFSKIPKELPPSKGADSLDVEVMQRIISYRTDNIKMRTALDIFIVSFALIGANLADLYDARPVETMWVYNRKKTASKRSDKAEMRVEMPWQVKPHIDRLRGEGEWWLNNLRNFSTTKASVNAKNNRWLARWAEDNGVDRFTLYATRHTWATLCQNECKVDKSMVAECLNHVGAYKVTDIYTGRAWERIQETNQKVLGLFKW